MIRKKYKNNLLGQSTMEYLIILGVVLAALISTGFITKIRSAFQSYFSGAVSSITP
jgi:uncharacterized protein (UPF0333 family)